MDWKLIETSTEDFLSQLQISWNTRMGYKRNITT